MNLKKLQEPFRSDEIEWRIAQAGKTGKGIWAKCLAYVQARAIMNRLDEVCGPENWRVEYDMIPGGEGMSPGVICKLSIRIGLTEWVTKEDGAEQTDIESFKGGISGALKRAAVAWGIGRYLYGLEEGFAKILPDKTQDAYYAKLKDGDTYYWVPPNLPKWALPESEKAKSNGVHPEQPASTDGHPAPLKTAKPEIKTKVKPKSENGLLPRFPTRDAANKILMDLYRPYLTRFPDTQFAKFLSDRYGVNETRLMTIEQINDLITHMETAIEASA